MVDIVGDAQVECILRKGMLSRLRRGHTIRLVCVPTSAHLTGVRAEPLPTFSAESCLGLIPANLSLSFPGVSEPAGSLLCLALASLMDTVHHLF